MRFSGEGGGNGIGFCYETDVSAFGNVLFLISFNELLISGASERQQKISYQIHENFVFEVFQERKFKKCRQLPILFYRHASRF